MTPTLLLALRRRMHSALLHGAIWLAGPHRDAALRREEWEVLDEQVGRIAGRPWHQLLALRGRGHSIPVRRMPGANFAVSFEIENASPAGNGGEERLRIRVWIHRAWRPWYKWGSVTLVTPQGVVPAACRLPRATETPTP